MDWVFILFGIVFFAAIVFAYYSRRGSDITNRPSDGRDEAPGAGRRSVMSATEDPGDNTFATKGTR